MDIQKESNAYLAALVQQEAITQDEFKDIAYKPEINAFHSKYLSSNFVDNINWGWNAWQAAKASAVPESTWQPIATAPKDKDILILSTDGVFQAKWHNSAGIFEPIIAPSHGCGCCCEGDEKPTHWMDLPKLIEAQEQAQ